MHYWVLLEKRNENEKRDCIHTNSIFMFTYKIGHREKGT